MKVAPYGSWKSPITSELIASGAIGLSQIQLDIDAVYWVEQRAAEGGRNVIVRLDADGRAQDVTPPPFNTRSRVHEYGGGAYTVDQGVVYFVNYADQRLYRLGADGQPTPLTTEGPWRYADLVVDRRRALIYCVGELHEADMVTNCIVSVPIAGGEPRVVVSGRDFYSDPRLDADGSRLAWLCWDQPNMPWDGTQLCVAPLLSDGTLGPGEAVAGTPTGSESIFQPEWGSDRRLRFVSDRGGWWNLYRLDSEPRPICPMEAEFATPQWVFGMSTYVAAPDETSPLVTTYCEHGLWRLASIEEAGGDEAGGAMTRLDAPWTSISSMRRRGDELYFIGASATELAAVIRLDLSDGRAEVLRRSQQAIDAAWLSQAETIELPGYQGQTAHGFFYRPRNPDFTAPAEELPPLLVMSHGGPTAATSAALRASIQYWTSRGIAVLDVNYGGSTGYGRAYRERLDGAWGIVDVADCAGGARFLANQGLVDQERLAITGGSAGGFTTLAALTFTDVFSAGASYYGVSDLEALALDTHKFEARYLDRLVGPYPERRELYLERSPIHHTDRLSSPMILFQGLEDKIVPPDQAEKMANALRDKGLPLAYLTFAGEQHGFRRAENIKRALDAELYFYSRIFAFRLAEPVDPVAIENLATVEME